LDGGEESFRQHRACIRQNHGLRDIQLPLVHPLLVLREKVQFLLPPLGP
jgi:hypothetical protein